MRILKKVLITSIFAFAFWLNCYPAYAYTGYAGGDTRLNWAAQGARDAKKFLDSAGYSTTTYIGSSFTYESVRDQVPYVRVFYVNCHGKASPKEIITDAGKYSVTPSAMYTWTRGFYKFAFLDACHSGETKEFYNSFNMSDGDGQAHAFLGWNNTADDNATYATFTSTVLQNLAAGSTVNDSVWAARQRTGVTNYQIYGNYNATLYN